MNKAAPGTSQIVFSIALAFAFWYFTFGLKLLNFWLSMSLAVTTLTLLGFAFGGFPLRRSDITAANFLRGAAAAAALYAIFWAGNLISQSLFHFARPEVSSIYGIRQEGQATLITLVLLFVTSPGEEFFWRGFLQRWAMARFGPAKGWLIASLVYGAVHIISGNFMLVAAALVAGLFWGFLYWRTGNIFLCIVSHALWTVSIFILFPVL
ncbi:MAG: type II CAAX endopeptidase family protein [Negativicutes bacterium]|nr:type II CAAX endopeptidase family protein [Negativicutes bacterium]